MAEMQRPVGRMPETTRGLPDVTVISSQDRMKRCRRHDE